MGIISAGIEWLSKTKLGQKIGDGLQTAKYFLSGTIKSMDDWFSNLGKRAGASPETSKTIGGAVRWGTGIGATGYALTPSDKPEFEAPGFQYPAGSFVPPSEYVPAPYRIPNSSN